MSQPPTQRITTFVSSTYLTNPETARLGRIVLDPRDPDAPCCDVFPDQVELIHSNQFGISVSPSIDLTGTYNSEKKKSLSEALLELFSKTTPTPNAKGMTLVGEVQLYQFENPDIVLNKVREREDVQQWLGEYVIKAKMKAYMVVGYHTLKSPRIHVKDKSIDNVAAGPGVAAISGVSNTISKSTTSFESFNSSGSQQSIHEGAVWGVQYRKVVCKLSHWNAEVKLKLKDNQWKMPWSVRGQDNTIQNLADAALGDAAEFEPEPADSDEEDEEPPEHYFNTSNDSEAVEEFIFFHDREHEA